MSLQLLLQVTLLTVFFTSAKSQSYGELRLVQRGGGGEESLSAGLLEIFLNEEWGNICEPGFDLIDANVACRQMGYAAAVNFTPAFFSTFGIGENSSVWLSNIDCKDPNGLHLLSCAHRKVGVYDCDHFSDVAVVCDNTTLSQLEDGNVRLLGGQHKSEGVVEIACGGDWRTVCGGDGAGFSQKEADAVCWQLGFTQASSFDVGKVLPSPDDGSLPEGGQLMENRTWYRLSPCNAEYQPCPLTCSNTEIQTSCPANNHNSSASYGIYVRCNHTITYGTLRLALIDGIGSSHTDSENKGGRLEMFSEGKWGTVCGAMFGLTEADLACRQLGYNRSLQYSHSPELSLSDDLTQPIVVMGIECTPEDEDLAYCSRPRLPEQITCTHNDDIILVCTDDPYPITTGTDQLPNSSWPLPFSKQILIEISAGIGFGLVLCCFCMIAWCTFCCCRRTRSRNNKRLKKIGLVSLHGTTAELNLTDDSAQKLSKGSDEDSETKEPDVIVLVATMQERLRPAPIPCTSPSIPKTFEISIDSPLAVAESMANNATHLGSQKGAESGAQMDFEKEHDNGKDKGKQRGGISMEPIPEEGSELEGEGSEVTIEQPSIIAVDDQVVKPSSECKNEISLDWASVLQTLDENIESASISQVPATESV